MNKKPIIGIVGRFDREDEKKGDNKKIGIGEYYVKMINKYGGIPIGILPTKEAIYNDLSPKEVEPLTEEKKEKVKIYDKGLSKSRGGFVSKLQDLTHRYSKINEDYFDELEEILITSDILSFES